MSLFGVYLDYAHWKFIQIVDNLFLQLQGEAEGGAGAEALRVHTNFALTLLDNILHDGQAETNALLIHALRLLQFTETVKKLAYVFLSDSCTCVHHLHM